MFEATSARTCLLTDVGRNMSDVFDEDYEVVTYACIEESIKKANYLLEHDDVRRQIATGRAKVHSERPYANQPMRTDRRRLAEDALNSERN